MALSKKAKTIAIAVGSFIAGAFFQYLFDKFGLASDRRKIKRKIIQLKHKIEHDINMKIGRSDSIKLNENPDYDFENVTRQHRLSIEEELENASDILVRSSYMKKTGPGGNGPVAEESDVEFTLLGMELEKVEWLNSIMSDLWPYLCIHVKNTLQNSVEPLIQEMEPKTILSSFVFTEIHLGSLPPRIKHVNAYRPKTQFASQRAKNIILDMEVEFCGNCNLQFKCLMLPIGVEDVIFKGSLRLEFSPLLIAPPFIGSAAVSFTEMPLIEFNLTGIGNIVEIPGIYKILRDTIDTIVGDQFVLPSKFIVPLIPDEIMTDHNLSPMDLMHPFPKGCIFVHIKYAYDLVAKDNIKALGMTMVKGKSDPYVKVNLGNQEFKTRVKKATLAPIWNEKCCFIVSNPSLQTLRYSLFDDDQEIPGSTDDSLGNFSIHCSDIYPKSSINKNYILEDTEKGSINVDCYWLPLKNIVEDDERPFYQKTFVSIVVETVFEIPRLVQEKYPQTSISLGEKHTLFLQTFEMMSYEHNFMYCIDDLQMLPETIKLRGLNNVVIASGTVEIEMRDSGKPFNQYVDIPLVYKHETLKSKCQTQQIRVKLGIRVRRAIGKLPFENITQVSPDKYKILY